MSRRYSRTLQKKTGTDADTAIELFDRAIAVQNALGYAGVGVLGLEDGDAIPYSVRFVSPSSLCSPQMILPKSADIVAEIGGGQLFGAGDGWVFWMGCLFLDHGDRGYQLRHPSEVLSDCR